MTYVPGYARARRVHDVLADARMADGDRVIRALEEALDGPLDLTRAGGRAAPVRPSSETDSPVPCKSPANPLLSAKVEDSGLKSREPRCHRITRGFRPVP